MSTGSAQPAPELVGGVSVAWLAMVGDLLRKEGVAFRAGEGPWIEVENLITGQFEPLTLENKPRGDVAFATADDRDAALRAIERVVYPLRKVNAAPGVDAIQQHKLGNSLAALARR